MNVEHSPKILAEEKATKATTTKRQTTLLDDWGQSMVPSSSLHTVTAT